MLNKTLALIRYPRFKILTLNVAVILSATAAESFFPDVRHQQVAKMQIVLGGDTQKKIGNRLILPHCKCWVLHLFLHFYIKSFLRKYCFV